MVSILVAQCTLRGTIHRRRHAQSLREEITAGNLAKSPADQSRAVVSNITILIWGLIVRRTSAGASTPCVGDAGGGHGLVEDLLAHTGGAVGAWVQGDMWNGRHAGD